MKKRDKLRWLHLFGAAIIGTFIYSPWDSIPCLKTVMSIVVIPLLTITGLWMWKPKWFQFRRKTIITTLAVIGLCIPTIETCAQEKIRGGSGGFMVGFKGYNTSTHQFFIPDGGPTLNNNLFQIGGEGYALVNRWIIGGNGYTSHGSRTEDNNLQYEIRGGGGFFNIGYAAFRTEKLLAFPLLGIGVDALGIKRRIQQDINFQEDRFLEANYFIVRPSMEIGAGLDWFPNGKGFKLGVRTGYNITLARNNTWRHYGGEITDTNLPENDLDGFYIRLTIGGGYIGPKR